MPSRIVLKVRNFSCYALICQHCQGTLKEMESTWNVEKIFDNLVNLPFWGFRGRELISGGTMVVLLLLRWLWGLKRFANLFKKRTFSAKYDLQEG